MVLTLDRKVNWDALWLRMLEQTATGIYNVLAIHYMTEIRLRLSADS